MLDHNLNMNMKLNTSSFFLLKDVGITALIGLAMLESSIFFNIVLNYFPGGYPVSNFRYDLNSFILPTIFLLIWNLLVFRDLKTEKVINRIIIVVFIFVFTGSAESVIEGWITDIYRHYPYIQAYFVSIDDKYASGGFYQFLLDVILVIISALSGTLLERILKKKTVLEAIKSTCQ